MFSGLGALGVPGLKVIWQAAAGLTAAFSLILLILFWHPWIIAVVYTSRDIYNPCQIESGILYNQK